jgi:hypothetical protein
LECWTPSSPHYSSTARICGEALHTSPKRKRGKFVSPKRKRGKFVAPPRLRFGLAWADESCGLGRSDAAVSTIR